MRGRADDQLPRLHAPGVEDRTRPDRPPRDVKRRADRAPARLPPRSAAAYSPTGRPGVPPERLLKALLLMALYAVRSERQLCERIDTDPLSRRLLGAPPSEGAFDPAALTHNRERPQAHGSTQAFVGAVVREAIAAGLCGDRLAIGGTLTESWAAAEGFQPTEPGGAASADASGFRPRNPGGDFRGQERTNDTHRSRADPGARLYREGLGKEAELPHVGHAVGESRHGPTPAAAATEAAGTAEREAAPAMPDGPSAGLGLRPATVGADKGYDDGQFLLDLGGRRIEPRVPSGREPRGPAEVRHPDRRPGVEARHRMRARQGCEGYRLGQRCREKIEEGFGWPESTAGLGRGRVVGRWELRQLLEVGAAAYNLIRLRSLEPA